MSIVGYVGWQGEGKTMWLTSDAIRGFDLGMKVVSNYPILDPKTGLSAEVVSISNGLRPMYEFAQDYAGHDAGVLALVQEIGTAMPARMWQRTLSFEMIADLAQTRKNRMHLHWDAQFIDLVDKMVRANTVMLWEVNVALRNPFRRDEASILDLYTGRKPRRPWWMKANGYRVRHLEQNPSESAKRDRRVGTRSMFFSPRIAQAYDTYAIEAARGSGDGDGPRAAGVADPGPAVIEAA